MKINSLSWILITAFLISCGNKFKVNEFETEVDVTFNDSTNAIIESYVNQFPSFNSFVLTCFQKKPATKNDNIEEYNRTYQYEFLLGPAYSLEDAEKIPLTYFKINNKLIFIKCGLEELIEINEIKESLFYKSKIPRGVDSVSIGNGLYAKDGNFLYLKRAIYLSIENDKIFVNYRPDTLFLPKYSNEVLFQKDKV